MIEILNYKPVGKPSVLQGFLDIKVKPFNNFIIREISYFKKDNQRWISYPSKVYEKDGKKKYYSYNTFEDAEIGKRFQDKIFEALDKYILEHPPMNIPEQISMSWKQDEIPF